MAKIKRTKSALKMQRDALRRYERYLPTLQLKKQQLQAEVRRVEAEALEKQRREEELRSEIDSWVALFAEPFDFDSALQLQEVRTSEGNIAGVSMPVLEEVRWNRSWPDPFDTPPWTDDGMRLLERLVNLRIERRVLEDQQRRLGEELRTTNQRVNLFEKVKIPECRENIRVIRIALGDQETAGVVRAKKAKGRTAGKAGAA